MAYTPATLTGTYQTPDGTPARGTVEIIPNSKQIIDALGDVILAGRVKVQLDETGSFSVNLPPTDDATLEPALGRQYTVVAKLHSSHLPAITGVELPAGATVDVADVASLPVVDPTVTLAATPAQLDALEASVAADLALKADVEDLATKADVTALDTKADVADIPTTPAEVGAEPAGLSANTNATIAATLDPLRPGGRLTNAAHTEVGQRRPIGVHPDGSVIGWHFGVGFVRSTDDTATWAAWGNAHPDLVSRGVREIRFMDNGEAVVIMMGASGDGEQLWVSTGLGADPTTATWDPRRGLADETQTFSYGGLSVNAGTSVVVASEYGLQGDAAAAAGKTAARKVYRSPDYGLNWSTVFDLHTTVPEGESGPIGSPSTNQHLHGSAYDPWWDRIWVAVGDAGGTNRCMILFSDDAGATWHIYPGSDGTSGVGQMVVPVATEKAVLFCSDFHPNGVWSIPRLGYRRGGTFAPAHIIDEASGIRYLGRSWWRNPAPGSPTLLTFTGVNAESPGLVVSTLDGTDFTTVYTDPSKIPGGANYSGAMATMGPTSSGKVVGYWGNPQRFANGSILTGYLPRKGPNPNDDRGIRNILRPEFYYAGGSNTTPIQYGQGVMRACPFHLPGETGIDRLGISVQAAGEAGSTVRLALYADDNGVPGDLIVDGGQVDGASTGFKEVAVDVVAGPGVVWLAAVAQSCPTTPPTVWGNAWPQLTPTGSTNGGLIAANGITGYECGGSITGAAPAVWSGANAASGTPRPVFRVA